MREPDYLTYDAEVHGIALKTLAQLNGCRRNTVRYPRLTAAQNVEVPALLRQTLNIQVLLHKLFTLRELAQVLGLVRVMAPTQIR